MTDERQKLLDQIKKLMALGSSPFEEEARTSLHKAFKKMKENNVTLIELAGLEQKPRDPTDQEIGTHAERLLQEFMRAIGRKGGLKGGPARARKLSAKRLSEIGRAAGKASGEARRRKRGY
jgi:general stress protein YciG